MVRISADFHQIEKVQKKTKTKLIENAQKLRKIETPIGPKQAAKRPKPLRGRLESVRGAKDGPWEVIGGYLSLLGRYGG